MTLELYSEWENMFDLVIMSFAKLLSCLFILVLAYAVTATDNQSAREAWEKEFNSFYIQPVLGDLDVKLTQAIDLVAKDDKQGTHC